MLRVLPGCGGAAVALVAVLLLVLALVVSVVALVFRCFHLLNFYCWAGAPGRRVSAWHVTLWGYWYTCYVWSGMAGDTVRVLASSRSHGALVTIHTG